MTKNHQDNMDTFIFLNAIIQYLDNRDDMMKPLTIVDVVHDNEGDHTHELLF